MPRRRSKRRDKPFPWRQSFLLALRESGIVANACKAAGISRNSAYAHYRRYGRFRRKWDCAVAFAWKNRSRIAWETANAELERKGWFDRRGIAPTPFPSEQRLREILGEIGIVM